MPSQASKTCPDGRVFVESEKLSGLSKWTPPQRLPGCFRSRLRVGHHRDSTVAVTCAPLESWEHFDKGPGHLPMRAGSKAQLFSDHVPLLCRRLARDGC